MVLLHGFVTWFYYMSLLHFFMLFVKRHRYNYTIYKMENLSLNQILNREKEILIIKQILEGFELNKNNVSFKKGIYIYGKSGIGKTTFVVNLLKELNFACIKYDAGDIRNKTIIETITQYNMSDKNILSMFHKKIQKNVIVMDEIDGMNSGDKGGINSLIKLIRPKKTKKQKLEENTLNPVICIGNYHIDKKIKELMKVCTVIELKSPTNEQMNTIVSSLFPQIDLNIKNKIIEFVEGDLKKLNNIYHLTPYLSNTSLDLKNNVSSFFFFENAFQKKKCNEDTQNIIKCLLKSHNTIDKHNQIMNETDRTIVGLLWHENIVDCLDKTDKNISIPFYLQILDNMCFSDYIDRITFQKQIWQFNEMSSLIKTFKNNKLYHDCMSPSGPSGPKETKGLKITASSAPKDIRFTKVLTKYSTEFNNYTFIQKFCMKLGIDKNDLISLFVHLKTKYNENEYNKIYALFESYEISKLDINRIYRYIDDIYFNETNTNKLKDDDTECYIEENAFFDTGDDFIDNDYIN